MNNLFNFDFRNFICYVPNGPALESITKDPRPAPPPPHRCPDGAIEVSIRMTYIISFVIDEFEVN